jgi:hypothetical protein
MINLFRYATASAEVHRTGSISRGIVTGIVTPACIGGLLADSLRWGGDQPTSLVVDYSQAVVAIDADALFESARRYGPGDRNLAIPTSIVASPDQIAMFREYASLCMQAGVFKAVFQSGDDAQRWSVRQALVREQWRAARLRAMRLSTSPTDAASASHR